MHICTHINKYNRNFQQIFLREDRILLLMVQEKIRIKEEKVLRKHQHVRNKCSIFATCKNTH